MRAYLLILIVLIAAPANAGMLFECTKFQEIISNDLKRPKAPDCMLYSSTFSGEDQREDCRQAILEYQSTVSDYIRCLKAEGNETINELNSTIDQFNRTRVQE